MCSLNCYTGRNVPCHRTQVLTNHCILLLTARPVNGHDLRALPFHRSVISVLGPFSKRLPLQRLFSQCSNVWSLNRQNHPGFFVLPGEDLLRRSVRCLAVLQLECQKRDLAIGGKTVEATNGMAEAQCGWKCKSRLVDVFVTWHAEFGVHGRLHMHDLLLANRECHRDQSFFSERAADLCILFYHASKQVPYSVPLLASVALIFSFSLLLNTRFLSRFFFLFFFFFNQQKVALQLLQVLREFYRRGYRGFSTNCLVALAGLISKQTHVFLSSVSGFNGGKNSHRL